MAIVKLNDLVQDVSGSIGGLELSSRGAQIVARHKPVAPPLPTPARLASRQRFREAAAYGRMIQSTPALRAVYAVAARARRIAPYHVAVKDFLNPPKVTALDLSTLRTANAGTIRIEASDDFEVVLVSVRIRTPDEGVIEEGDAVLDIGSGLWLYELESEISRGQSFIVEATAVDRPAHTGTKALCWCMP